MSESKNNNIWVKINSRRNQLVYTDAIDKIVTSIEDIKTILSEALLLAAIVSSLTSRNDNNKAEVDIHRMHWQALCPTGWKMQQHQRHVALKYKNYHSIASHHTIIYIDVLYVVHLLFLSCETTRQLTIPHDSSDTIESSLQPILTFRYS